MQTMKKAPQSERTRIPKRTTGTQRTAGFAGRRQLQQAEPHRKIYDAARKAQVCAYHLYSINHGGTQGCTKGDECHFRHHLPEALVVPYGSSGRYVVFRTADDLVGQATRGPNYRQTMLPSKDMDFAQWAERIRPMSDDAKCYRDHQNLMKRQAQRSVSKKRKVGPAAKPRALPVDPIEVDNDDDVPQLMVGSPKPTAHTPRGKDEVPDEPVEQKLDRPQPPKPYPVALPGRNKVYHSHVQWLALLEEQMAQLQAQRNAVASLAAREDPILNSHYTARCLRFEHLMLMEPRCGPGTLAYQLRYQTIAPHALGRLHASLSNAKTDVVDAHNTLHRALERAFMELKQFNCFHCHRALQESNTKACHDCYAVLYCDDACRRKDLPRHAFGCYPHPSYLMHYEQVARGIDHNHPHQEFLRDSATVDVNCEAYAEAMQPPAKPSSPPRQGGSSTSAAGYHFEPSSTSSQFVEQGGSVEQQDYIPERITPVEGGEYSATSPPSHQLLEDNIHLEGELNAEREAHQADRELADAQTTRLVKELAAAKAQLKLAQARTATAKAATEAPPAEAETEEKAEDPPIESAKDKDALSAPRAL